MHDPYRDALALVDDVPDGTIPGMVCNVCEWGFPIVGNDGDLLDESFVKILFLLHLNLKHPMEAHRNSNINCEETVALLESTYRTVFADQSFTWEETVQLAINDLGLRQTASSGQEEGETE